MLEPHPAWPEDWATMYDAMDVDRGPHVEFYAGLVTPGVESLLDLGCGTGSITVAMAERMAPGARVVGVDLSPKMIEIARARAPEHDWVVGDICAPPVEGRFDLVVICFHTLQALLSEVDLLRCLRAVAARLAPGGRFAFDVYQPNLDWLASVDDAPRIARRFRDAAGRDFEVVERDGAYDPRSRILSGSWTLHDAATGERLPLAPIISPSICGGPSQTTSWTTWRPRASRSSSDTATSIDRRSDPARSDRSTCVVQADPETRPSGARAEGVAGPDLAARFAGVSLTGWGEGDRLRLHEEAAGPPVR